MTEPDTAGAQGGPVVPAAPAGMAASRRLARLLDDLVKVPGTDVGLGLDAVIGLVPGVGDVVGSTLSGAIVYDAVRHRVPVPVLARMGWNLLLDAGLGLVPVGGDLLDVAHRANRKNFRLLEQAVAEHPAGRPTVGYVLVAGLLVVLPLLVALAIGLVALWFLLRWALG